MRRNRPKWSPSLLLVLIAMEILMVIIVYSRYSSAMQRPESCADQERNVRDGLKRFGVPGLVTSK